MWRSCWVDGVVGVYLFLSFCFMCHWVLVIDGFCVGPNEGERRIFVLRLLRWVGW
jgi:hypothetical protein